MYGLQESLSNSVKYWESGKNGGNDTVSFDNQPQKEKLNLNSIYWEDDEDSELEFLPKDIFAEERLLEKGNLVKTNNINNNYEKFITEDFETVTQFTKKIGLQDLNYTEFEDATTVETLIKPTTINSQKVYDLDSSQSSCSFRFHNKPLGTYSVDNQTRKINSNHQISTAINLEEIYDSESCQSSGSPQIKFHNKPLRTYPPASGRRYINSQQRIRTANNLQYTHDSDSSQLSQSDNIILSQYYLESRKNYNINKNSPERQNKRNFPFSKDFTSCEELHGFFDSDDRETKHFQGSLRIDEDNCIAKNQSLDVLRENISVSLDEGDIDLFPELDDKSTGFTQVLLNNNSTGINHYIPPEKKSKKATIASEFSKNCKQNISTEIEFPDDKLNQDSINSDMRQNEDILILSGIEDQNLIKINSQIKLESDAVKHSKCEVPLNSMFNSLASIKTDNENLGVLPKSNEIIENQIFEGFKYASNKPIIISENALKKAITINNMLNEDIEENADSISKSVKFKAASDKSMKIEDDGLVFAEEFFNDADVEIFISQIDIENAATDKSMKIKDDALVFAEEFFNDADVEIFISQIDIESEITKNPPHKNQFLNDKLYNSINLTSPLKDPLLEANNFLKGISAEIANVQTPQFVKSGLGKPKNISKKSLHAPEKVIKETNVNIANELLMTDQNLKWPVLEERNNEIRLNSNKQSELENYTKKQKKNNFNYGIESKNQKNFSIETKKESKLKQTIQKHRRVVKKSKNPNEINLRGIRSSRLRLNGQKKGSKVILKKRDNLIKKKSSTPEFFDTKENFTNSFNSMDTTMCVHITPISQSQLGIRKYIPDLPWRRSKPPATTNSSNFDDNSGTSVQNSSNDPNSEFNLKKTIDSCRLM